MQIGEVMLTIMHLVREIIRAVVVAIQGDLIRDRKAEADNSNLAEAEDVDKLKPKVAIGGILVIRSTIPKTHQSSAAYRILKSKIRIGTPIRIVHHCATKMRKV